MRQCPRCKVALAQERRAFAELDRCAQCGGTYLEPGEGVTGLGHAEDIRTMLRGALAETLGASPIGCPSGHGAMTLVAVGDDEAGVELDICTTCGGVWLDPGETELVAALQARAGEISRPSGARFAAPPPRASHPDVVDAYREEKGKSAIAVFFQDVVLAAMRSVPQGGEFRGRPRGPRKRFLRPD